MMGSLATSLFLDEEDSLDEKNLKLRTVDSGTDQEVTKSLISLSQQATNFDSPEPRRTNFI